MDRFRWGRTHSEIFWTGVESLGPEMMVLRTRTPRPCAGPDIARHLSGTVEVEGSLGQDTGSKSSEIGYHGGKVKVSWPAATAFLCDRAGERGEAWLSRCWQDRYAIDGQPAQQEVADEAIDAASGQHLATLGGALF